MNRSDQKLPPGERAQALAGRISVRSERISRFGLPGVHRAVIRHNAEGDVLECGHVIPGKRGDYDRRVCRACRALACRKSA